MNTNNSSNNGNTKKKEKLLQYISQKKEDIHKEFFNEKAQPPNMQRGKQQQNTDRQSMVDQRQYLNSQRIPNEQKQNDIKKSKQDLLFAGVRDQHRQQETQKAKSHSKSPVQVNQLVPQQQNKGQLQTARGMSGQNLKINSRDPSNDSDRNMYSQFVYGIKATIQNQSKSNLQTTTISPLNQVDKNSVTQEANRNQMQNKSPVSMVDQQNNQDKNTEKNFLDILEKALDLNFSSASPNLDTSNRSNNLQPKSKDISKDQIIQKQNMSIQNHSIRSHHIEQELLAQIVDQSIEFDTNEMLGDNIHILQSRNDSMNIGGYQEQFITDKSLTKAKDEKVHEPQSQLLTQVNGFVRDLKSQVTYLDDQLTRAKGMIKDYQLICSNQQEEINNLRDQLNNQSQLPQMQHFDMQLAKTRDRMKTPDNITNIIRDIEKYQQRVPQQNIDPFEEFDRMQQQNSNTNLHSMNSNKIKQIMIGMTHEQQELVESLLNQLAIEQQMRLESEEQHQQMIDSMEENQKKLEQQLKQVKNKMSQASILRNSSQTLQSPRKSEQEYI